MDEFRFSDNLEEQENSPKKKKGIDLKIVVVVVISLVAGLSVYFISNAIFGKKTTTPPPTEDVSLKTDEEIVKILYDDVTYGVGGNRNLKYLKEKSVKLENFTNYEKFYYALKYVEKDDLKDTSKVDDVSKKKIYAISNDLMKKYMKKYFGEKITYSLNSRILVTFPFEVDGLNTGELKYDVDRAGFIITFNEKKDNFSDTSVIKPYYTKLSSASINKEGQIILTENVIYTSFYQYSDNSGNKIDKYDVSLYKDYNKTMLIEKKTGITKEMIDKDLFNLDNYKNNANTITYTFNKNYNGEYYFYSSEIRD